jgi:hypothetical protein
MTYQAVQERMLVPGWNDPLDLDTERPDNLMQSQYLDRFGPGKDRDSWLKQHQKMLVVDFNDECLVIDTNIGCTKYVPLNRLPKLFVATSQQRTTWQFADEQRVVEWPDQV